MTIKERLLATIQGKPVDQLPYLPRLDIWYNARKLRGTLPDKYKNATLKELTEDLGLGYHYIIPNYKAWDGEDRDVDIGLGHYRFNTKPFRLEFHNMKREWKEVAPGKFRIHYTTPVGEITCGYQYTDNMRTSGLTLNVIDNHAIKYEDVGTDHFVDLDETIQQMETVAYLFENCEVIPDYEKYDQFREEVVGDNGLCIGYCSAWASPMHYICQDLMGPQAFHLFNSEEPELLEKLNDRLMPFFDKIFDANLKSKAELILTGANFNTTTTPPSVFEPYVMPVLQRYSKLAHEAGKFIITHPDGENAGLLDLYAQSGMDVADSICPAPMTRLPLKEYREKFGDKITIWGGIPSIALLEGSFTQYEFEKYINDTLETIGDGRHIILGIADTTPPDADLDRILYIKKKAEEFGPVR